MQAALISALQQVVEDPKTFTQSASAQAAAILTASDSKTRQVALEVLFQYLEKRCRVFQAFEKPVAAVAGLGVVVNERGQALLAKLEAILAIFREHLSQSPCA